MSTTPQPRRLNPPHTLTRVTFYYYDFPTTDICLIINQVLRGTALSGVSYPSSGAVIDTRGILNVPDQQSGAVSPFPVPPIRSPVSRMPKLPCCFLLRLLRSRSRGYCPATPRFVGEESRGGVTKIQISARGFSLPLPSIVPLRPRRARKEPR